MGGFGTFVEECESERSCISSHSTVHSATCSNSGAIDATNCETHAVVEESTPKTKKGVRTLVQSKERYKRLLLKAENILCESLMRLRNALDDDAD